MGSRLDEYAAGERLEEATDEVVASADAALAAYDALHKVRSDVNKAALSQAMDELAGAMADWKQANEEAGDGEA